MAARQSHDVRPWYRQLWPWLIFLPPAATVAGGLITLGLALHYPEYDVRDGHYRDGLGVYLRGGSAHGQAPLSAVLVVNEDGRVDMKLESATPIDVMILRLIHPTRADEDRSLQLTKVAEGHFAGALEPVAGTHWSVRLEAPGQGWELVGSLDAPGLPTRLVGTKPQSQSALQ